MPTTTPNPQTEPYSLIGPFDSDTIRAQIAEIALRMFPEQEIGDRLTGLARLHDDIVDLFHGRWPNFRASNTAYHNLEHTQAVALACARYMHGAKLCGEKLTPRAFCLGMTAAYFHDAGLIQDKADQFGTGAKHTKGHEQRSINMMAAYLSVRNDSDQDQTDCGHIIESTILVMPVENVGFRDADTAILGRCLAAADLMAQMADWAYLEKLALLFQEFEEAEIPGFASEIMLLEKTQGFYDFVAKQRLDSLGNISGYMRAHYQDFESMDRDPYQEATLANLAHLRVILETSTRDYAQRDDATGFEWAEA